MRAEGVYRDRTEAGERLAAALPPLGPGAVVLALPRGGVPVAVPVARALGAPLDLALVRKVGAPGNPEVALAAVTGPGPDGLTVNEAVRRMLGVSEAELRAAASRELDELERRRRVYLGGRPAVGITGRTVVVVDDGLATGMTAKAALKAVRGAGAARVILAVPVALGRSADELQGLADEIVCPIVSNELAAVGQAYLRFPQVSDADVVAALDAAAHRMADHSP